MSRSRSRTGSSGVKSLVQKIFRQQPVNDLDALSKIRDQTNSKTVAVEVFQAYKERRDMVERKGQKFANLMRARYGSKNLPYSRYEKKALKYKKKYNLSDDEFAVFKRVALTGRTNLTNMYNLPNTSMAKTLGYTSGGLGEGLHVRDSELGVVQEILRKYSETKNLHFKVTSDSLTYRTDESSGKQDGTLPVEVRSARYLRDYTTTDRHSFIHPVVVALYSWKLAPLERQTIIGNIGHIVKCKHERRPVSSLPDYELYWSLITDPNETVCDSRSPITDLRNRYELQCRLWDCVSNLRQGRVFDDKLNQFLVALDQCKVNMFDAPDLTYIRDEGMVLRRILSAFSVRPTTVSSTPIWHMLSYNPHFKKPAITQVHTIPMITFRLPLKNMMTDAQKIALNNNPLMTNQLGDFSLTGALTSAEWFVEGKLLVPKTRQVLYSRGVLIFYVNRRYRNLRVGRMNVPYSFNYLPMTVGGLETLNTEKVNINGGVLNKVGYTDDTFTLASAVLANTSNVPNERSLDNSGSPVQEVVTSTSTMVFDHQAGSITNAHHYDPSNKDILGRPFAGKRTEVWSQPTSFGNVVNDLQTKGTIFIFKKMIKLIIYKNLNNIIKIILFNKIMLL